MTHPLVGIGVARVEPAAGEHPRIERVEVVGRDGGGADPRRDPRRGEIAVGLHLDGALRMRHPRETVGEGHGSDTRLGLQPQPQLFVPLPVECGELLLGELRPLSFLVTSSERRATALRRAG